MALPTPTLSAQGKKALSEHLDHVIRERSNPATWLGVTTASGEIYFEGKGERVWGEEGKGQVDDNTLLQIFSTTKLVTTIAALQQVDKGLISLDDSAALFKICPELEKMQVFEGFDDAGRGKLRDARTKMTLRMLLNHTCGLTYAFSAPDIGRYCQETGVPSMWSDNTPISAFIQPLAFDPGSHFRYGLGPDWAGIMVARLSGQTLEEYFQENIFKRCGMTKTSFLPPRNYGDLGMAMTVREPVHTGDIKLMGGSAMGRPMDPEKIGPNFMGGGGLFGTAKDYLSFLRGILRSADPSTPTDQRLISPESFKLLFKDSTDPQHATDIKKDIATMAKEQHIHDPAILADGTGEYVGFAPALLVNQKDSKYGRKAGSGCWDGAAKTYYWIDPTTGIAAVCFTNLLSHNPDPFNKVHNTFERILYDNLS